MRMSEPQISAQLIITTNVHSLNGKCNSWHLYKDSLRTIWEAYTILIDLRERNRQLWRCACEWKSSTRRPSWHSTTYCREREREEITFARKTFRMSHLHYYVQKTMIRSLHTSLGWPPLVLCGPQRSGEQTTLLFPRPSQKQRPLHNTSLKELTRGRRNWPSRSCIALVLRGLNEPWKFQSLFYI